LEILIAPNIEESALEHMITVETIHHIEKLIDTLPPKSAEGMRKLYLEGKSLKDTAVELFKSIHTIKSLRARGISILGSGKKGYLDLP
jgi:DNA-directed RNA polymerase specialized sigma24 family protein